MFPFLYTPTSVFILSETEFAKYKQKQTQSELAELDKLIDGHRQSIERLEATKAELQKELPKTEEWHKGRLSAAFSFSVL